MTNQNKTPRDCSRGASSEANSVPVRPWKRIKRNPCPHRASTIAACVWRAEWTPPLQPLSFEIGVLRALLTAPNKNLYYNRHKTLFWNRLTGFERVAQAVMANGDSHMDAVAMLLGIHAEYSGIDREAFPMAPWEAIKVVEDAAAQMAARP